MKTKWIALGVGGIAFATVCGCDNNPKSARGFRLPEGNAERGRQAFLELKCNACHRVQGEPIAPPGNFNLTLGGKVTRVKTYGELVTSIINPSHVLSESYRQQLKAARESPMPDFNRQMTVQQLIDLVAFLQPHYQVVSPEYPPQHF